jgi:phospholipid/cholesterol/gamma-HCH transport system ATP-binding protein
VDLDMMSGETLVIMGRSGSGKSVLTSMLVGLQTPDSGSLTLAGIELTELTDEEQWDRLRLLMGYLFQGSALYDSMTVGENVAFPLVHHSHLSPADIAAKVEDLLTHVGLPGIQAKMPADLSGGMQRRVALARTLATSPRIIIYDEPTTGLDPITSDGIAQLIQDLQATFKVSSLIVTHDLRLARRVADRLAMLYEGKIVFQGSLQDMVECEHPEVRDFVAGTILRENQSA